MVVVVVVLELIVFVLVVVPDELVGEEKATLQRQVRLFLQLQEENVG